MQQQTFARIISPSSISIFPAHEVEHQLAFSGSQVAVYISLLLPQTYVDLFQVTGQLINSNDSIAATSTLSHMSTNAPAAYSFIRWACV